MLQLETPVKQEINLPVSAAIHECERELSVRSRCYAKWVKEGKLTTYGATEQFDRLAAAIEHLKAYEATLQSAPPKVLDSPAAATA